MNAPSEKEILRIRARKAEAEAEMLASMLEARGVLPSHINEMRHRARAGAK